MVVVADVLEPIVVSDVLEPIEFGAEATKAI